MFFVLFPQECLFRDAGPSVKSSVLVVQLNCPLHISKSFPVLTINIPLNWYLKCVYRQSTCW